MRMKILSKSSFLLTLRMLSIVFILVPTAIIAIDLPESFYAKKEEIKQECARYLKLYYRFCCLNYDENDDYRIQERLDGFRAGKRQFEQLAIAHTVSGDELESLKRDFDKELQIISERIAKDEVYQTLAGFHLGDMFFNSQSFAFEKYENYTDPIHAYNRFQVIVQKNKRVCENEIQAEGCDCGIATDELIEYGFSTIRRKFRADELGKELKSRLK